MAWGPLWGLRAGVVSWGTRDHALDGRTVVRCSPGVNVEMVRDNGGIKGRTPPITHASTPKKQFPYDMPNLSTLPAGQRRAVEALIGDGFAQTYHEAARLAGMSEGTLLTHFNRVRQKRPELYEAIREVRLCQLAERHEAAMKTARIHSLIHFRKQARWMRREGLWVR